MKLSAVKQMERALNMLLPRFSDAFFVQADVSKHIGGAQEKAVIEATGEAGFQVKRKGRTETLLIDNIIPWLADIAKVADILDIRLIRRNETVVVQASERGTTVKMEKPLGTQVADNDTPLNATEAGELLRVLGFTDAKGEIRPGEMRKYNQINQFLKAAFPVLRELAEITGTFSIIDAACGKSHLSFILNHYLTQVMHCKVHVIGIDVSPGVIATANKNRDTLGYRNAEYHVSSVAEFYYDKDYPVGLTVSLHACDTATDEALSAGVRLKSRAIIAVPCCQRELLQQIRPGAEVGFLAPFFRHGLLKARFADLLTDNIRCLALQANGYAVSVQEFCSPIDTPKNLMLRAVKSNDLDDATLRKEATSDYRALKQQFTIAPSVLERLF